MEKFWAVILIFVIVAAGGLLYVNQVYNPQKETQMAMADTANQTLSAVKMEMGNDTTPTVVDADSVRAAVISYCAMTDNSVEITVVNSKGTKKYTNNSEEITVQLSGETRMFLKKPKTDSSGKLLSIRFEAIEE